jgi:hypothetical protein
MPGATPIRRFRRSLKSFLLVNDSGPVAERYMKRIVLLAILASALAGLPSQLAQAQGTMTYVSNLDQSSVGSVAVGSNSWLTEVFRVGTNPGGYVLNSIQLAMTDAVGSPGGFQVCFTHPPEAALFLEPVLAL